MRARIKAALTWTRWKVIYWQRRLAGRCVNCGGGYQQDLHYPDCLHCWMGWPHHLCHWCMKLRMYALSYGMGREQLLEMFEKEVLGG